MPQLLQGTALETVDPRIAQTVPRALVHKRSLENVLLTGISTRGGDRFVCTGRVPVAHGFFNDAGRTPQTDILFYTELGRQASLAISHAFLDVSTDDVFIFERSEAALTDAAWSAAQFALDPVVVEIQILDMTRRRNNAVSRVVAEHVMWIGEQEVFRGKGAWTVQTAALFQRLRRGAARSSEPSPVDVPSLDTAWRIEDVPLERPANVVVTEPKSADGGSGFVASLVVDQAHPYFFDHPCDHVPGMLLLEGCAQLAVAAFAETRGVPRGAAGIGAYHVNFAQFVECGIATTLTAHVNPGGTHQDIAAPPTVEIVISQQNVVSGTTTMRIAAAS